VFTSGEAPKKVTSTVSTSRFRDGAAEAIATKPATAIRVDVKLFMMNKMERLEVMGGKEDPDLMMKQI